MSIGEFLMRESDMRLNTLRRGPKTARRGLGRVLRWGAWINYLVSVLVLTAGISAGWHFAEVGFDLMMSNVSSQEVQQQIIKKIPAWMLVYKGIKLW